MGCRIFLGIILDLYYSGNIAIETIEIGKHTCVKCGVKFSEYPTSPEDIEMIVANTLSMPKRGCYEEHRSC